MFTGMRRLSRLVCAFAVALVCVEAVPAARALDSEPLVGRALTSSFLCTWKWDLEAGLRTGYVTAGNSANCAGRQGSLTLSVHLLRLSPKSKKWNVDKAQTRTWTDLRANRYVEVAERCSKSTVRAVFDWVLRDTGRTVISRHSLTTASLKVPSAACQIGLGGPGKPAGG